MLLLHTPALLAALLQSTAAPGLLVSVFHRGEDQSLSVPATLADLATLMNDAANDAPDVMYTDAVSNGTALQLSGSDDTATSDFLGPHANPQAYDGMPLYSTLLDFRGAVTFDTPGSYTLSLSAADDLAAVYVGGNGTPGSGRLILARNIDGSVASAPGLPNPVSLTLGGSGPATFPIEVVYYNQDGGGLAQLDFTVRGPGQITYTAQQISVPDPMHLFEFASTDCQGTVFDTAPSAPSNGVLKGGATVADSRMNTYGTAWNQGACLTGVPLPAASSGGSFTLQQRFFVADPSPPTQTLFSFATDANNFLLARAVNQDGNGLVQIDLANRYGAAASLLSTDLICAAALVHLVYDADAQQVSLYLNGRRQGSTATQAAFSLQAVAANLYTGIGGFSVFGDPSLNGSCTQFVVYDAALSHDQIGFIYATQ